MTLLAPQMDGVKNTLNKVVTAEFDIPKDVSNKAGDLISCLLKKVGVHYCILEYNYNNGLNNLLRCNYNMKGVCYSMYLSVLQRL